MSRSDYDLRNRAKVKLVSICDELHKQRNPATDLFSPEKTDAIVINWDAMNGDPVYGSDRCYDFLDHYRPDMLEWLCQGGLLLVESQGASWSGAQGPYDCFASLFPGSEVHLRSGMWTLGARASIHPNSEASPLATGLGESDLELSPGGLWARRAWFPRRLLRTDIQSLRFVRRHQHHLHRGWFDAWSADWKPILAPRIVQPSAGATSEISAVTEKPQDQRAIALCRAVSKSQQSGEPSPDSGFIVVTTMFIASSELLRFVSNFLGLSEHEHSVAQNQG